tara:strand:+ start:44551 stop:46275 length:1725 start_codon:yes stop_codon:yes gene_type:complete
MAKIVDPDDLLQSTNPSDTTPDGNVFFDVATKQIELIDINILASVDYGGGATANRLSSDGSSLQAVYSFSKEEWKDDTELIKYAFPFIAITAEQFELTNDWDFISNAGITLSQDETKNLLRDAGWALKDANGDSLEEYMNITSLGAFNDSNLDQGYILQLDGGTPSNIILPGEINQAIKILGAVGYGNFDYTGFFKIYLREQAKIYAFYDLIAEQNLTVLTYRKYALPLANASDIKVTNNDAAISVGGTAADQAPYSGMSITYYAVPQDRGGLVGGTYSFDIIIDGNSATAEQIYEFVQWSLRQSFDIDAGTGSVRGDTAEELLEFIGDTLRTKSTQNGTSGVYIDNFNSTDTNRIEFTDNTDTVRAFPFVASGTIQFNENLTGDAAAKYWVFFTNTKELVGTDIGITQSAGYTGSIYNAGSVNFATFSNGDYLNTTGFATTTNNGVYQITATPSATNLVVYKVDEIDIVTAVAGPSVTVSENPYGSPDAIIVNEQDGSPISGTVSAQSSISFDFDYDGNTQGNRTAATNAKYTAVSIGLSTGQYVITTGSITRTTTNVISFVAALERNYSNPV